MRKPVDPTDITLFVHLYDDFTVSNWFTLANQILLFEPDCDASAIH